MKNNLYSPKKYENPYFKERPKKKAESSLTISDIDWKKAGITSLILIILVSLTWLLLFSNFLQITDKHFIDIDIDKQAAIAETIDQSLSGKRFFFFPAKNFFIVDLHSILSEVRSKYSYLDFDLSRSFPRTIVIKGTIKRQAAIWHEDSSYYKIDADGDIIDLISDFNPASSSFPIIDNQTDKKIDGSKAPITLKQITYSSIIYDNFNVQDQEPLTVDRFFVDQDQNSVKLSTANGPKIFFSTNDELTSQLTRLDVLIKEKIKGDISKLSYIDLRFGEIVNYK